MSIKFFFFLVISFSSMGSAYYGSCSEQDQQIYGNNSNFINVWQECGRGAMGDAAKTVRCISRTFPELSQSCGTCFGAFTACGANHCRRACFWDSRSSRCIECGLENCGPAWEQCTGSNVDLIKEPTREQQGWECPLSM